MLNIINTLEKGRPCVCRRLRKWLRYNRIPPISNRARGTYGMSNDGQGSGCASPNRHNPSFGTMYRFYGYQDGLQSSKRTPTYHRRNSISSTRWRFSGGLTQPLLDSTPTLLTVGEIFESTKPQQWWFVPGILDPADDASRRVKI